MRLDPHSTAPFYPSSRTKKMLYMYDPGSLSSRIQPLTLFHSVPPSFRHSISSTPSLIMFAWILGFTWLALSTVLASILGISIQHEAGRRELVFLAIEVGLSLLEAILLFALAMRCLRERELDCGAEKVRSFDKVGVRMLSEILVNRNLLYHKNKHYIWTFYSSSDYIVDTLVCKECILFYSFRSTLPPCKRKSIVSNPCSTFYGGRTPRHIREGGVGLDNLDFHTSFHSTPCMNHSLETECFMSAEEHSISGNECPKAVELHLLFLTTGFRRTSCGSIVGIFKNDLTKNESHVVAAKDVDRR